jgi:DNA (cytosine-5)-methyltransferase 1
MPVKKETENIFYIAPADPLVNFYDTFAGGGGSGAGILSAYDRLGMKPSGTFVNHWDKAIEIHSANHPEHRHFKEDLFLMDPVEHMPQQRYGLGWASPSCQQFSISRGNRPINEQGRSHADTVVSWMAHCMPECQIVENVKEFLHWCRLRQRRDKKTGELLWAREVPGKKKGTTKIQTFPSLEPEHRRRKDEQEEEWEKRMIALGYDRHLEPDLRYRGEYFREWVARIEALGYIADWKLLRSADYGDPTIRQRLFVQFVRKDTGKRIVWPDQRFIKPGAKRPKFKARPDRHLEPWPTARNSVIDWSHKGTSIFKGRKPLAKATMRRIAIGTVQFGLRDFFVPASNFGGDRVRGVDEPISTVQCNHRGEGLAQPELVPFALTSNKGFDAGVRDLDKPTGTLTCNSRGEGVVEPYLVPNFGERPGQTPRTHSVDDPLPTATSHGAGALVEAQPFLLPKDQGHLGDYVKSVDSPVATVQTTAVDHLVEPCIIQNNGQSTAISVDKPIGALTGCQKQYVLEPHISHLRNGNGASSVDEPARTLTAAGQHQLLAEAFLLVLDNAGKHGNGQRAFSVDEPVKTIPVKANQTLAEPSLEPMPSGVKFSLETLEDAIHKVAPAGIDVSRVLALLEPLMVELKKAGRVDIRPWVYVYYSSGSVGSDIDTPVPTIRCKEGTAICYPVLEFDGEFMLLDILYRMLTVKELQRAQGFPDGLIWPEGITKTDIVKAIGNSVSCGVAEALVLAWHSQDEDISGFFEEQEVAA